MQSETKESIGIPAGARSANASNLVWMLLVAFAAIASRAFSFSSGLVYDDNLTLLHRSQTGWASALASFTHNQSQGFGSNFYRPVLTLWYEGFLHLLHVNAAAWHTVAILLHVACALLVFRLVRELSEDLAVAAGAAILFAVHPSHVESIGWISAMGDPLMACFLLMAVLSFLRWLRGGGSVFYGASLAAALGCVLSKETGVVMPVLVLAAGWALPVERRMRRLSLLSIAPYFVISLAFLAVRRMVLSAFYNSPTHYTTAQMIATWPSALLFYLRHLAWPEAVVPFYPLRMAQGFGSAQFWLPLCTIAILAAVVEMALWKTLGARRTLFCVAWTLVPLAPVMMLKAFTDFELVQDRFLYVPLIGFCAAIAWMLRLGTRRMDAARGARIFLLCVAGLALAWGFRSLSESLWWQNDRTLFTRALQVTPQNPRAMVNLGDAYMRVNRMEDAIPLFQHSLTIDPNANTAHFGLGLAAYRLGDYPEAERQLVQALRLKPRYDEWAFLARTELRMGKLEAAERAARVAVGISGGWPGAYEALGEVLLAKGDRSGAAAAFQQELQVDPASQPALEGLAQALGR